MNKYQDVINKLKKHKQIKLDLKSKRIEHAEAIKEKAIHTDSLPKLNVDERTQSSNVSDPTYKAAQECIDIYDYAIKKAEREVKILQDELDDIENRLRTLTAEEEKLIKELYMTDKKEKKNYVQLACQMGYSVSGLYKIRDRALQKMKSYKSG